MPAGLKTGKHRRNNGASVDSPTALCGNNCEGSEGQDETCGAFGNEGKTCGIQNEGETCGTQTQGKTCRAQTYDETCDTQTYDETCDTQTQGKTCRAQTYDARQKKDDPKDCERSMLVQMDR
jgi:hypothetical protein